MKKRIFTITTLIVFMTGGLLFGAIKMIDITQSDTPPCQQQPKPECFPRGEKPVCPLPNPKWQKPDCFPRGERPVCPLPNPTPCPLESAAPGTTK
ncbi:hypothetical protein C6501_10685 [Candidatus Poribacteria bacterium]|nr:MAG: hypothetical protein C6501_10685 [Candidatus Poribacteria bacterium]